MYLLFRCRAKRQEDRHKKMKSKFLFLRFSRNLKMPDGYFQGIIHTCDFTDRQMRICTESGKFIEIQVMLTL